MKKSKQDNIKKLRDKLEELNCDLESNESEQMELRSIARSIEKDILDAESELEELLLAEIL